MDSVTQTVTVTVTKNIYNAPPTNRQAAQYKVVHVFAELKAWLKVQFSDGA